MPAASRDWTAIDPIIIEMKESGKKNAEIAQAVGVDFYAIVNRCYYLRGLKRLAVTPPPPKKEITAPRRDLLDGALPPFHPIAAEVFGWSPTKR